MADDSIQIFDLEKIVQKNIFLRIYNLFVPISKNTNFKNLFRTLMSENETPKFLIIYNIVWFRHNFSNQSKILEKRLEKLKSKNYLIYDYSNKFIYYTIADLFNEMPGTFGWRGDIELWEDLQVNFKDKSIPKSENELLEIIEKMITDLTGHSINKNKDFFVEKHYHGSGMSGGIVNSEWWNNKGIPLILGRFKKMQNCA